MLQRSIIKPSNTNIFVRITSVYFHHDSKVDFLSTESQHSYNYFNSYSWQFETCTNINQLQQLHAHLITFGQCQSIYLMPKLVTKYTAYGSIDDARQLFDKTREPNLHLSTAMINGYVRNGFYEEALSLYHQTNADGIRPDNFIFSSVVKACAELSDLQEGMAIHEDIVRTGSETDVVVGTSLVAMYAECREMEVARQIFDRMPERNLVSWSAIIAGYALKGDSDGALRLFNEMQMQGIKPDLVIMVSVLPAFARLSAPYHAECVHGYVTRSGFESDFAVSSGLIDIYAKCGRVGFARQVFDTILERSVGSWNAMIGGYTQNGYAEEALALFYGMQLQRIAPDLITIVSILPACTHLSDLKLGKRIHRYVIASGFHSDVVVGTALIDMYTKCGDMKSSRLLFGRMPKINVATWNAMIAGYAYNGQISEALAHFCELQLHGLKPDAVTILNTLSVCAHLSALQQGKRIHGYAVQSNLHSDVAVCNALIDMYAKCGTVEFARQLFDSMSEKSLVSWNSMIGGYGMHGHGKDALALFSQMQEEGITPNHITFIAVLSACSHSSLLDEGRQCFDCMIEDHYIIPSMEHYACMVDLLGRSGLLEEACDFISKMPLKPNAVVWGILLAACRVHGSVLLGEHAMKHILELGPQNCGHYVLLSNIYAEAGRWNDAVKLRNTMKVKGLKKTPGCSWIEINNIVHSFFAREGEIECYS